MCRALEVVSKLVTSKYRLIYPQSHENLVVNNGGGGMNSESINVFNGVNINRVNEGVTLIMW